MLFLWVILTLFPFAVAAIYMKQVERCEHDAFTFGGRLSDVLNAKLGDIPLDQRLCQEEIMTSLGFYPDMLKICASYNLTESVEALQHRGGWGNSSLEESSYSVLNHKWLYMMGDSTTRQIFSTFAGLFYTNAELVRNPKEFTRAYCNKQLHRDEDGVNDGWTGPCMKNTVTCHISGFGTDGVISWDWKHFPWEHYDEHLWGSEGHFMKGFDGEGDRRPEIFVVQTGLHTCFHNYPENVYDVERIHEPNLTAIEQHKQDVRKLMQTMRSVIESYRGVRNHTHTVVFMTSGASFQSRNIDDCIVRFNRVVEETAHEFGFAVLERGALEAHYMYKSIWAKKEIFLPNIHLKSPAPNLITTVLVRLLSCLRSIDMSQPWN